MQLVRDKQPPKGMPHETRLENRATSYSTWAYRSLPRIIYRQHGSIWSIVHMRITRIVRQRRATKEFVG